MTDRKTALVTGANKGIGWEIARGLGRRGYRVWLGSRDAGRGEAAADALRGEGLDVRALTLDVTDDASVADATRALAHQTERLDALVNNAGIAAGRAKPTEESLDSIRDIHAVNVFGPIRVTRAMLPLLRRADAPRIVMVSSSLGSLSWASDFGAPMSEVNLLGYASSKSALNMIMLCLAKELGPDGFKVNSCCPGYTATDLNQHQGHRTPEQGAAIAVRLATLDAEGPTGGFFDDGGVVAW